MKLKLIKCEDKYKDLIIDFLNEWKESKEKVIPAAIIKNDWEDFKYYKNNLELTKPSGHLVPDSTYFCLDQTRNIIVGAVNIRHYLNDGLLKCGGHIGDGIRPSKRNKGYGSKMIALALKKCETLGIEKVLMVCNKDNIASAKSIINNNGQFENEIKINSDIIQRYWIDLSFKKSLISQIEKIHTTELGYKRISKNLHIDPTSVLNYCKTLILNDQCEFMRKGKNYYCKLDNVILTINSFSFTIISAHIV